MHARHLNPGFYGALLLGMRGPTLDYLPSLYVNIALWVDPMQDAAAQIAGAAKRPTDRMGQPRGGGDGRDTA